MQIEIKCPCGSIFVVDGVDRPKNQPPTTAVRWVDMDDYNSIQAALNSVKAERDAALAALKDCASGLRYIREVHGELYGVGFDRALDAADSVLKQEVQP